MSGTIAASIRVSEMQQRILERIRRRSTSGQGLVERAQIILACRKTGSNVEIGRQIGVNRNCIAKWRGRWQRAVEALEEMERRGVPEGELEKKIEELLADAARSGTPPTFSAYQVVQIVAVGCEKPQESGRPITHWTPKELADEVMKRGIVERISQQSVGRFLKGERSAPPS